MECECSCQIGRLESLDVTTVELFHFSLSIFLIDDLFEMLYENFGKMRNFEISDMLNAHSFGEHRDGYQAGVR